MTKRLSLLAALAALALAGCGDDAVAERERADRANALFAEALAAADRGDDAGAEALYRRLLTQDGANAAAHLNLAILQHDARKDYAEAIHHYRWYLDLQPKSEKAAMVRDRIAAARTLLTTQLAADALARERQSLDAERDGLRAQIRALDATAANLRAQLRERDDAIADLESRVRTLQRLVDAMKAADAQSQAQAQERLDGAQAAAAQAPAQEPPAEDTSALIKAIRLDAQRMIEEPDGGQAAENAATRQAVEGQADEPPLAASPIPGHRYLVRPGDTLSRLAREAYDGNAARWVDIRDANRATLSPDGRLRVGQTILIP